MAIFAPKMLMSSTRLPKSTMGEEIRNENVTPRGRPALVKPMNSGMEEHEQTGVTVPSRAAPGVCHIQRLFLICYSTCSMKDAM